MSGDAAGRTEDLCGCEACGELFPYEKMTLMCDCWFCEPCTADWQKSFNTCDHRWTPEMNEYSEPSQYCAECSGLVRDEDFDALFGDGSLAALSAKGAS